jgi:hypothetical protein
MRLVLFVVRKHVYNYNCLFKAADHIHVGVRTCTVHTGEIHEREPSAKKYLLKMDLKSVSERKLPMATTVVTSKYKSI